MRSVFIGTGAFVGRVEGATRLAFWSDDPIDHAFDSSRLISVDLSRTPNAAAAQGIDWEAVEIDDGLVGPSGDLAGTTLGPRWPEMQLVGAAYLEENFLARLPPASRPACPPKGMGGRDYEFKCVVYWPGRKDPRGGRRYVGRHAEILEEAGKLARVAIFKPGLSDQRDAIATTMWIDLSSPDQCDAGHSSLTRIAVGDGLKAGALFVAAGRVIDGRNPIGLAGRDVAAGASDPKLPPFTGDGYFVAGPGGPKIPPYAGDIENITGLPGPKLPPFAGVGDVFAGASGPKLPPYTGDVDIIPGLSSPKLPYALGE